MSVPWPAPEPRRQLRTEQEVELRLLYRDKNRIEPRIRELEQLLKGGERG